MAGVKGGASRCQYERIRRGEGDPCDQRESGAVDEVELIARLADGADVAGSRHHGDVPAGGLPQPPRAGLAAPAW